MLKNFEFMQVIPLIQGNEGNEARRGRVRGRFGDGGEKEVF